MKANLLGRIYSNARIALAIGGPALTIFGIHGIFNPESAFTFIGGKEVDGPEELKANIYICLSGVVICVLQFYLIDKFISLITRHDGRNTMQHSREIENPNKRL